MVVLCSILFSKAHLQIRSGSQLSRISYDYESCETSRATTNQFRTGVLTKNPIEKRCTGSTGRNAEDHEQDWQNAAYIRSCQTRILRAFLFSGRVKSFPRRFIDQRVTSFRSCMKICCAVRFVLVLASVCIKTPHHPRRIRITMSEQRQL